LSIAQNTLAEDFYNMYETKADMYNAALKNQDVGEFISFSFLKNKQKERKKIWIIVLILKRKKIWIELFFDFYNMYETKADMYNAALKNQDVGECVFLKWFFWFFLKNRKRKKSWKLKIITKE